jgi:hypothetical protein
MSSVMQAGPCVRSNQLDYDEDVMYKVSSPQESPTKAIVRVQIGHFECTYPHSDHP